MEVAGVEPASSDWHVGLSPIRYQSHPRYAPRAAGPVWIHRVPTIRNHIAVSSRTPDSVLSVICLVVSTTASHAPFPWRDCAAATGPIPCTASSRAPFDVLLVANLGNGPPALLPVGHSPSRRCLQRRWQALTLPVRPFPARTAVWPYRKGGYTFCCSCRHSPFDLSY